LKGNLVEAPEREAISSFDPSEETDNEQIDGWAIVWWKKGPKEVCTVKTVMLAGVWAIRVGAAKRYPDYRSATAWSRIKMISREEAHALLVSEGKAVDNDDPRWNTSSAT
jgi:hypothetical protein